MPEIDPRWLQVAGVAALMALLIGGGIAAIQYYRNQLVEDRPANAAELLETFQEAYDEGDLDDEEYARIRAALDRAKADPGSDPDLDPDEDDDDIARKIGPI